MGLWEEPELERQINAVGRRFWLRVAVALAAVAALTLLILWASAGQPWLRHLADLLPGVQGPELPQ